MSRVLAILGMVIWVTGTMLYDLALSTVKRDKVSKMRDTIK